ncbi:hypothetical protein QAD02_018884 [Eretmocerus hayati]|uniref:Uncharacterized protein n=1 Tax=Eretmocerus hayati TaxID=131215 RepID=A0ACC2PI97_9HYME|nr:hypothetical protein QAD02_018884 [Eretmocerus hayati]
MLTARASSNNTTSSQQQQTHTRQTGEQDITPPTSTESSNTNNSSIGNGANPSGGVGASAGQQQKEAVLPLRDENSEKQISTTGVSGPGFVTLGAPVAEEVGGSRRDVRAVGSNVRLAGGGGLGATSVSGGGGYWSMRQSRPCSPRMPPPEQEHELSQQLTHHNPRPRSRHESNTTRYNNLGYWRARRVTFYRNGDPYFPGVEFRFKPGRDIGSIEALLDRLSLRLDLPRGARYIFSMDGDRKLHLDELEDGASYVVSSYKTFKV